MSLVSNFIGGISSFQFGGNNLTSGLDMNDSTFSDLLQKQMDMKSQISNMSMPLNLGIPTGINIEDFESIDTIKEVNTDSLTESLDTDKMTTSETVTFFDSLLNNIQNTESNQLMDFAKRQAANLYNQYSRSIVTDVNEFVEDIHK